MSTFVPIPNGIEIVIKAVQFGSERVNVHGAKSAGATPTLAECTTAAGRVHLSYGAHLTLFSDTVHFTQIIARDISQVGGAEYTLSASDLVGSNPDDALPGNVTFSLKRATGVSGRGNRGRLFMFGMVTSQLDAVDRSQVTDPYLNGALALMNALKTNLDDGGLPYSLASRSQAQMIRYTGFVAVDNFTDSMRKRLVGRGR